MIAYLRTINLTFSFIPISYTIQMIVNIALESVLNSQIKTAGRGSKSITMPTLTSI